MKKIVILLLVVFVVVATVSFGASAKDLSGRFGIGYQTEERPPLLVFSSEGISGRFWFNPTLAVQATASYASIQFSNGGTNTFSGTLYALKVLYKIIDRLNYHVYIGAGINGHNYSSSSYLGTPETSLSGTGYEALMGVEWFFSGVPDLGFSLEWGWDSVTLTPSEDGGTTTLSATPLRFAAHYYFGKRKR
ncbi:hypothetical protein J7K97_04785 [Candidatus Aerophobetes bacterium]|nr:hypothetical protein [Candidatus Aerophobetes bacterium]